MSNTGRPNSVLHNAAFSTTQKQVDQTALSTTQAQADGRPSTHQIQVESFRETNFCTSVEKIGKWAADIQAEAVDHGQTCLAARGSWPAIASHFWPWPAISGHNQPFLKCTKFTYFVYVL